MTGTIQVGLRTIDSNVGLGANNTLKTRLNELSVGAGVGVGVAALAMSILRFQSAFGAVLLPMRIAIWKVSEVGFYRDFSYGQAPL
jgi:hypothetical protein